MRRLHIFVLTGWLMAITHVCGNKTDVSEVQPRLVKAILPDKNGTSNVFEFNATVLESHQAEIAFRVGGPVTEILADMGDYVKTEQLLASIDTRDYQIQLRAAEAQYNQANGEYERYLELYNQDKLPANTFEKLKTAMLAAQSNWENAKNALADTRLKAPFSGYIFKKSINLHETIAPGTAAFTILNMDDLEVVFGVPETMISRLEKTTSALVLIAGTEIPASIKSIAGKSGSDNLYEVRLSIKNPDVSQIRPGMSAKAIINSSKQSGTHFTVPVEAVFHQQGVPHIWIVDENSNTVSAKEVRTGQLTTTGQLEILDGLKANEKVVSAGTHSLHNNQSVRVMSLSCSL